MGSFKSYLESVSDIWSDATPAARVGIILLSTLCCAAVIGVGYWSAQPTYVTLLSDTELEKMDKVIDALDKAAIDYKLTGAGGNLQVDKREFSKARMIARGKGVSTPETIDFGNGGAFGSPTERKNAARLRKQESLANTIRKFNVVEQADVHLNVPDKGPFERKTSPPTASVMLTLVPGSRLTDEQASSIASLVAFAVEDLQPEEVRITDKDGRTYSVPDERAHHITNQVEYVTENERKLAEKAETQLVHFLGAGNASVQVSLDLTFTNGSKTTTKYDADGKVATEEDLNTETSTKSDHAATGAAGVESNLKSPSGPQQLGFQNKTETIKTSYLVPKTEETQTNTTPTRNFMTVSVLVNSDAEGMKQDDGSLPPGIEQKVQAIVENAVGFKKDTDTISVEFLPFPESTLPDMDLAAPFNWAPINEIIRNASLAIAAIVALLIGLLTLRKIKPVSPPQETIRLDTERNKSINQLSELVKNNPQVFSQLIQNWSTPARPSTSDSEQKKAA